MLKDGIGISTLAHEWIQPWELGVKKLALALAHWLMNEYYKGIIH